MIQHVLQTDPTTDWEEKLPMIQYQLNGSRNASMNKMLHQLMYGMNLY